MLKTVFALCAGLMLFFSQSSIAAETIKIYAASSMTNAVNEISEKFSQQTGVKITPVYGSSSALARQIERGAPADLYISANQKWVDYLIGKGLFPASDTKVVAKNRLALITPVNNPVSEFDLQDARLWAENLKESRLAIGQINSVPAGIYGKQSLMSIGIWSNVEPSLAQVNNVRVALALVERGESPLGIVYQTDALVSDRVTILQLFPDDTHSPIVYPAAKLSQAEHASEFYNYLTSNEASEIFSKYGFQ